MIIYSRLPEWRQNAAVAQSVERRIGSAEVTGPIPVSSFFPKGIAEDSRYVHKDV